MEHEILVRYQNRIIRGMAKDDENLHSFLIAQGVFVESPCGGNGKCGKCLVKADGNMVPACKTRACDVHEVDVTDTSKTTVMDTAVGYAYAISQGDGLAAAVDIGTTTVVVYLVDCCEGRVLASVGERNAQSVFGADVISRIQASMEGNRDVLRHAISGQIANMAEKVCRKAGKAVDEITRYAIAGNTVMLHFLSGLDAAPIARAPFIPESLFGSEVPAKTLGLQPGDVPALLMPCVAGYVGGDITSGLMACGIQEEEKPCLLIDLGTNGEMALGNRFGIISCATAAGPAFEGGCIECGCHACSGAVSHVWMEDGKVQMETIDHVPATGICGSGLMDLVAVLLQMEVIDETGRLQAPDELDEPPEGLVETEDGVRFYLNETVYLSAKDVRQIQMAKAAVAAGIRTLLDAMDVEISAIEKVWLAGGFGTFLRKESAAAIGLIPKALLNKVVAVGNSAGLGAVDVLISRDAEENLSRIVEKTEYLELSNSAVFRDEFVDCMSFEEGL